MSFEYASILVFFGACAGFLSGLIGIGGGFIIVPVLMHVLPHIGVEPLMVMKIAISTSMAVMVPTCLSSLLYEYKSKGSENLTSKTTLIFCMFAAVGSMTGTLLAGLLAGITLQFLFLAYMTHAAYLMVRPPKSLPLMVFEGPLVASTYEDLKRPDPVASSDAWSTSGENDDWINKVPVPVAALVIGAFSSLIGLGGAAMVVLYLTARRSSIHSASIISNAVGLSLALAATVTVGISDDLSTRVQWSAAVIMAIPSVLFSGLGVYLKNKTPHARLKQIFGFVLLTVVTVTLLKIYL